MTCRRSLRQECDVTDVSANEDAESSIITLVIAGDGDLSGIPL